MSDSWVSNANSWSKTDASGSGSSLPALTGNDGKVLTVSTGGAATEWAAAPVAGAAGTDTQVQFNDGGAVLGGDAGLTFNKTTNALSSTGPFTLTPTADVVPMTVRAYSSGTNHIAQFQDSSNGALSHISHTGVFVGNVTGNASGSSGSCTGNAATASDGLSTASGTAPLTLTLAAKGLTGSVAAMTGATGGADGAVGLVPKPLIADAAKFLRGDATWAASAGGGITNSAGANVVTKSDGTNVVATTLTEASAGAFATGAGVALGFTATAPAATTGASQAGKAVTITASPAVASTDTNGAAAGGSVTITAGAAARKVSGDANGGNINLVPGAGIGTGTAGQVINPDGTAAAPSVAFTGNPTTGAYNAGGAFNVSVLGALKTSHGANNLQLADSFPLKLGTTVPTYLGNGGTGLLQVGAGAGGIDGSVSATSYVIGGDATLRRKGAANPAWGLASATPVAYTHSLSADSRGGTDTDVKGAKTTLVAGLGTGSASGGDFSLQTGVPGTTGTAANTPGTRWYEVAAPKALTSGAAATGIFEIAMPVDDTYIGYEVSYTIGMTDGTNAAIHTGKVFGAAYRATGGTVTGTNPAEGSEANHNTSGSSTTDTWTVTAGTGKITVNLTSTKGNAVGTVTKSEISYSVRVNGRGSTVTPL